MLQLTGTLNLVFVLSPIELIHLSTGFYGSAPTCFLLIKMDVKNVIVLHPVSRVIQ